MPVYDKAMAMLVAFYFIENNTYLTLEGARGSTAVPISCFCKKKRHEIACASCLTKSGWLDTSCDTLLTKLT